MLTPPPYRIYPCGDHAVTIELGHRPDPAVNQKVMALFNYLSANRLTGLKDIIPAYHTVTVVYDIPVLEKNPERLTPYENICRQLSMAADTSHAAVITPSRLVKIPVCYHPSFGPDIEALSQLHGLSTREVVQLHSSKTYHVYMIGFLPGFAYMGSVDEKLFTPRRAEPRTLVPAGSVGIAGEQTGIYPFDSPGGWQLIGRTPLQMFDIGADTPCYLQPGDNVQFYPVTIDEFTKMQPS